MAVLRLIRDGEGLRNEVYPLGETTTLGRAVDAAIVLAGQAVSREHARIVSTDDGYFIEDLNSGNGTYLNGEKIQRARLHQDDIITLHNYTLEFVDDAKPGHDRPGALGPSAWLDTGTLVATLSSEDFASSFSTVDSVAALRRRLEVLYGVSRSVAGSLSVESVLGVILEELFNIFDQADYGCILMREAQTDAFSVSASRKRSSSDHDLVPSTTIIQHAHTRREAVLSESALDDARFQAAQSLVATSTTSVICAPLIGNRDVLGLIYIAARRPGRPFRQDDLQLVVCVAATVAIFLQNARLHEEVVQAQRLKAIGQTVAGMAHCIKNILNGIQGGAYILDQGIEGDDKSKVVKGWEITKRNNEFLSNLVLDMLSYAKDRKPRYEPTDINDLVRTACDLYVERAKKQGTELRYDLDSTLSEANVDSVAVYRCILNLVSNAVDACNEKAEANVCVRTTPLDATGCFTIQVEDTGAGMPEEVKTKLFSDFFSTKGAKGTGLGLPVVKKIVEEHSGALEVVSAPGAGSTFIMRLPLNASERKPEEQATA